MNSIAGKDLFNQMLVYSDMKIMPNNHLMNSKGEYLAEVVGGRTYFRDNGKEFQINLVLKSLTDKKRGFLFLEVKNIKKKVANARELRCPRNSRNAALARVEKPDFKV